MGNEKLLTLIASPESFVEAEMICAFKNKNSDSKYVIYSKNEKDQFGNNIIYACRLEEKNNKQYLLNIEDANEWIKIKNIIKKMNEYMPGGVKYEQ